MYEHPIGIDDTYSSRKTLVEGIEVYLVRISQAYCLTDLVNRVLKES